jgi:outer membrane protein assembly factor BamB
MARVESLGLALESHRVSCPSCAEDHTCVMSNGKMVVRRVSVPLGYTGPVETECEPLGVDETEETGARSASTQDIIREVLSLPEDQVAKGCAEAGRRLSGDSSHEILKALERLPHAVGLGMVLSVLHYHRVSQSDMYWAWYLAAFSLRGLGLTSQAMVATLRALALTDNPNASAWSWLEQYYPDLSWQCWSIERKHTAIRELIEDTAVTIPSAPEDIATFLDSILHPRIFLWESILDEQPMECEVADSRAFMLLRCGLHCVDLGTGKRLWTALEGRKDLAVNTYVRAAGRLAYVFLNDSNQLLSFDANDGSIRWSTTLAGRARVSDRERFIGVPSALFFVVRDEQARQNYLLCLSADNGSERWRIGVRLAADFQNSGTARCLLHANEQEGLAYAVTPEEYAAFDMNTGQVLWRRPSENGDDPVDVCLHDDYLLVGSHYGRDPLLACLHRKDGKTIWVKRSYDDFVVYGTTVCYASVFYEADGSSKRSYAAIELRDGKAIWQRNCPEYSVEGMLVAENCIIARDGHSISAYDPKTGERVWHYKKDKERDFTRFAPSPDTVIRDQICLFSENGGRIERFDCVERQTGELILSQVLPDACNGWLASTSDGFVVRMGRRLVRFVVPPVSPTVQQAISAKKEAEEERREEEARRKAEDEKRLAEEQTRRQEEKARLKAEDEKRRVEEERRRQEEEARRRAEEERRAAVQATRKSSGQCIMCGERLSFMQKLLGKDRHGACRSFKE